MLRLQLARVSAVEQKQQCIWSLADALDDVVLALQLALCNPAGHLGSGGSVLVGIVETVGRSVSQYISFPPAL